MLKDWRGLKVGDKLMEAVIGVAEQRGQTQQNEQADPDVDSFAMHFEYPTVTVLSVYKLIY